MFVYTTQLSGQAVVTGVFPYLPPAILAFVFVAQEGFSIYSHCSAIFIELCYDSRSRVLSLRAGFRDEKKAQYPCYFFLSPGTRWHSNPGPHTLFTVCSIGGYPLFIDHRDDRCYHHTSWLCRRMHYTNIPLDWYQALVNTMVLRVKDSPSIWTERHQTRNEY